MQKSIYLVNPAEAGPAFHGAEVLEAWGMGRVANVADLSTTTVAALIPAEWSVSICDERIEQVNFDHPAGVIGITGKVSQFARMVELAREFRQRGKIVIIGGPFASLNPDDVRPHADILVVGEFEEIATKVFSDLSAGTWEDSYNGGRPDLKSSPIPRWDLYPKGRALSAQVQTSRGCPFECEFCDVIQYLGRKQRWKDPDQVIRELEVLYSRGARTVFLADDNFTVMRRRTRELLERLIDWNDRRPGTRMLFSTQVSIDLAREAELMNLCVAANLRTAFVGIETPNEESLAETMKRQNLRVDLSEEVTKIVRSGIMVTCGMIVGFDHDGPDIFQRQVEFINGLPVPLITFGLLVAPPATPLHARMAREGRLINHDRLGSGSFLDTNIRPLRMSEAELKAGARWLLNRIYEPRAFAQRVRHFVEICGTSVGAIDPIRPPDSALAIRLSQLGTAERHLVQLLVRLEGERPDLLPQLKYILLFYCQVRYLLDYYGVWDPKLAKREFSAAA
ncbi:MAG: radical SAM protein [Methyloceanibacter sp.]